MVVTGEAEIGTDAVSLVRRTAPDVLLLDVPASRRVAVEILREIETVGTRTVLLTHCVDAGQTLHALRLGVRGVVSRVASVETLLCCIRSVAQDRYWVHDGAAPDLSTALTLMASNGVLAVRNLTAREIDIVSRVAEGATNRQIAAECKLSLQTVKNHLSNIYEKLGVQNRIALAMHAVVRGMANQAGSEHRS